MKISLQNNLSLLLLVALLLPFLGIAFFCHPSADDYAYAWSSKQIGVLASCQRDYLNWNGRYFSNLLVFLNPISFNQFQLYKLFPVLLILGSLGAIFCFLNELFETRLRSTQKILLSVLLMLLFLIQMPQLAQGIYWYTGAITYQGAAILMLLYFTHLLRYSKSKFLINTSVDLLLLALSAICIVGFNEVAMLYLLFFHTILLVKSKAKGIKVLSLIVLVSALFVLFSPGNSGRGANFQNSHQLWHSLSFSVLQTIRFFLTWISSYPLFLVSLLFIPFAGYLLSQEEIKKMNFSLKPIESLLILFALIFIAVFPAYWGMGILGQHRTLNFACFFFGLFWFFNLFLWIKKLAKNNTMARLNQLAVDYKIWIFVLLLISFFLRGNLLLVSKDLLLGKAYGYNRQLELRYQKIANCINAQEANCVVDTLQFKPASLFNFDISSDENYWINKGEAAYFRLSKIKTKAASNMN